MRQNNRRFALMMVNRCVMHQNLIRDHTRHDSTYKSEHPLSLRPQPGSSGYLAKNVRVCKRHHCCSSDSLTPSTVSSSIAVKHFFIFATRDPRAAPDDSPDDQSQPKTALQFLNNFALRAPNRPNACRDYGSRQNRVFEVAHARLTRLHLAIPAHPDLTITKKPRPCALLPQCQSAGGHIPHDMPDKLPANPIDTVGTANNPALTRVGVGGKTTTIHFPSKPVISLHQIALDVGRA